MTHLRLVPRLRMNGAVHLLRLYAFMVWTGLFYIIIIIIIIIIIKPVTTTVTTSVITVSKYELKVIIVPVTKET
jgi:hypothetical protein